MAPSPTTTCDGARVLTLARAMGATWRPLSLGRAPGAAAERWAWLQLCHAGPRAQSTGAFAQVTSAGIDQDDLVELAQSLESPRASDQQPSSSPQDERARQDASREPVRVELHSTGPSEQDHVAILVDPQAGEVTLFVPSLGQGAKALGAGELVWRGDSVAGLEERAQSFLELVGGGGQS